MQCLFSACQVTLGGPTGNAGDDENITKLRDAIIDAFISIVHGMQGVAPSGSPLEQKLQANAVDILHYIDALLTSQNLNVNDEFIRNLYELYIDITEYYGEQIRGQLRQMQGPGILKAGVQGFIHIEGMQDISHRFMQSLSRFGCV